MYNVPLIIKANMVTDIPDYKWEGVTVTISVSSSNPELISRIEKSTIEIESMEVQKDTFIHRSHQI